MGKKCRDYILAAQGRRQGKPSGVSDQHVTFFEQKWFQWLQDTCYQLCGLIYSQRSIRDRPHWEHERIRAHPMSLLSGSNAKISEVGRHTHRCIKGKAAGMLNAKSGNHTVFLDLAYKHCHFTLKPIPARHSFPKKASRTPASLPRRVCASCKSLGCSAYTHLSTIVSANGISRNKCLYCGHI